MIHHHPTDALLVAYGAGGLTEPLALVVATHLSACPACRDRVADIEMVGGSLLDDLPPEALAPDALDQVLARLDDAPAPAPAARPHRAGLPGPLGDYLDADLANLPWRRMAPGIHQVPVVQRGRAGARLLRIAPSTALPPHSHAGQELTLVLDGAYEDDTGRFATGDLAEKDDSDHHRPVTDPSGDCICLVATEAPLRFSGLVPRLMQPLIGI